MHCDGVSSSLDQTYPPMARVMGGCAERHVAREADHRIANHLALLAGLVRLRAAQLAERPADLPTSDAQALLGGILAQIDSVSRLHRSLGAETSAATTLSGHLGDVCTSLRLALCGQTELVQDFSPTCVVGPDQILPLTQIVAEVIANAIKHARPANGRAVILVSCRDEKGRVCVEITDNGGGFSHDFDPNFDGGVGFRLIRGLGKQLGADMGFESDEAGLRFRLTLPPTV